MRDAITNRPSRLERFKWYLHRVTHVEVCRWPGPWWSLAQWHVHFGNYPNIFMVAWGRGVRWGFFVGTGDGR